MFGNHRVYLDYAAGVAGNPSSPHAEGRAAKQMLEDARTKLARLIEVHSDDVIFTSGATESNALAILGSVRAAKARGVGQPHVLYLPSAHASIVENARRLESEGAHVELLPIKDYRVDAGALSKMLRPETVLVTMEAVCGETGVVWNTREVAQALTEHNRRIISLAPLDSNSAAAGSAQAARPTPHPAAALSPHLHVDASQAPFTEKISRAHFGANLLTLDGAKVGVRGVGLLVAPRAIPLEPLYQGGGQERGLRPGSEDPERTRDFVRTLVSCMAGREEFRARAQRERAAFLEGVRTIAQCEVNEGAAQAPQIVNLSLIGRDTDYLVALLDEAGFAVSTKSACETDAPDGSRAVRALTGDAARAQATLRVSWGPYTKNRDLQRFCEAVRRAVAFLDSNASR